MEKLSECLEANRKRLTQTLRWPENIGIEMREVRIGQAPHRKGLLVFVDGLASVEALTGTLPEALRSCPAPCPEAIARHIPLIRTESTHDYRLAVSRLLAGWALLLVDGSSAALLLETPSQQHPLAIKSTVQGTGDVFSRDLRLNVALLRRRLRSADLSALPVRMPPERAGGVALVYLEGTANPAVVRLLRRWAAAHVVEEKAALGTLNRASAVYGLLPRFSATSWADKAAAMVGAGYVALIVEGIENVYIAPVTMAGWLTAPNDHGLILPLRRWLMRTRLYFAFMVMLLPGVVVALLNYHQEMIPTAFLLAVGAARESAPFGVLFEVVGLELLTEVSRGASALLPVPIPAGVMMIILSLIVLTAVLTGFVGPFPALAVAIGVLMSQALPSAPASYLVRLWRFVFIVGAVLLGFFGMATVYALLIAYLCRARTWGIPFIGPSGSNLTAAESNASRRPEGKGVKHSGKGKTLLR